MHIVDRFPRDIIEVENLWIELGDGCRLAARVWMPADAKADPVPAILEYLPYRKRDGTAERDELTHPYFAGHGYAAIRVDMRGNGDSDGLMHDEYTVQEQDDCLAVIAWIAAQPWCDGNLGMMGISWGGFNALQVAALRPQGLKAIITLCSTDDRYRDDIHFKGGCLLSENLGWGATMLAYSSRPPDPLLVGERWREMWLERLEGEPFLALEWLRHPHRDAYWRHGSVCEDFAAIEAAVLAVGGWNDAYTDAIPRLLDGLGSPTKAIIGPWTHKYPHVAVPEPRIGFLQEALRWWDHWLKGIDTGVRGDPAVRYYVEDSIAPDALPQSWPGRWVSDDAWPPVAATSHYLYPVEGGLARSPGGPGEWSVNSPQSTGLDGGEFCIIWLGPEFAGDQARDDRGSLTFDSEIFDQPIDITGAAILELAFSVDRPVAFLAVRLNDIRPDGSVTRISYTTKNLCHHASHESPEALEPGRRYRARIQLNDIAWHLPAGHALRLSLSTCYWPLIWPAPEAVALTVHGDQTRLKIPIRPAMPGEVPPDFDRAEGARPTERQELRRPEHTRTVATDAESGVVSLKIVDDFGRYRNTSHGLVTSSIGREEHRIHPDDPLSARMDTHWTEELARDGWSVRSETYSRMWADAKHFHLAASIEAYENGELVFEKSWQEMVRRRLN